MEEGQSEKLEIIFETLDKSTTEEDILHNLTKIVKGFSIDQYKNRVLSNPYFKSLIPDIKSIIYKELQFYKESINDEIKEIDKELNGDNSFPDKLKSLRRDCISLLYEIEKREKELDQL